MKKILLVTIIFLLGGCGTQRDLAVQNSVNSSEQVLTDTYSQDRETDMKSSVTIAKKDKFEEETTVALSAEKANEPVSENLLKKNTSVPTEQIVPTEQQEEISQIAVSKTEETPAEPTDELAEPAAGKIEDEAPKTIYDYEFDVKEIRRELIGIGTEMGLEVDESLAPGSSF